jgi:hypothetical protein
LFPEPGVDSTGRDRLPQVPGDVLGVEFADALAPKLCLERGSDQRRAGRLARASVCPRL